MNVVVKIRTVNGDVWEIYENEYVEHRWSNNFLTVRTGDGSLVFPTNNIVSAQFSNDI